MADKYIDKFKKGTDEYVIYAEHSNSANTSSSATTAVNANAVGKVGKYSTVPNQIPNDDKYREGLIFENDHVKVDKNDDVHSGHGIIELNSKGNFTFEALEKHANIEAAKGIQMKPTTNVIIDSTRRLLNGGGNEVHIEAKCDDYKEIEGADEWSELKMHSRNLDLRCHNHGGIALQIAGCDNYSDTSQGAVHHENKIKFESDRAVPLSDNYAAKQSNYNGEGGKGLEFGTFNNEHTSLFTHDYRFNKDAKVYGVTRERPVFVDGKFDYPTQTDDFKDVINEDIAATWEDIIKGAKMLIGKSDVTSSNEVSTMITNRIVEIEGGGSIDLDGYATEEYVQNYVSTHGGGGSNLSAGNGIIINSGEISVDNYSNIEPLTALTNNTTALNCVKIGKDKGNFKIDVKGKYTYEANVDAIDEYGNEVLKGGRVVNYSNEDFYNDPDKYYYKALVAGLTYEDNSQNAQKGACAYKHEAFPSVSVGSYFYVAKKNAKMYPGDSSSQIMTKGDVILQNGMTSEEISYYDGVTADTKWTKGYILKETDNEAFYSENSNWEKTALWITNEINVNLETDSKIKFDGAKIETTWDYPETEGGDDVSHKMEEISLSTEDLVVDATQVSFESKVTKNGDFVDDTNIVYVFDNKLLDENGDAVIDVDTFRSNYRGKHPQSELTDEEVNSLYSEYIEKGKTETISVRISDLLKLVNKVAELETRIAALENQ